MAERAFDVVLYGATGFTGKQTVRYFAEYAPAGLRWAVAGRNRAKLEALGAAVPVLVADASEAREMAELAARTRVMLSMGPYALYGDALVTACVEERTHYVDITGEVAWVRSLIDRHHERAAAAGTRIVPFCGFDSVPADLGVWLLRQALGEGLVEARAYFQARGGGPNGGTIASAHSSYSSGDAELGRDAFLLSPGASRAVTSMETDPTRAFYDGDAGVWVAPFPMSLIDTRVVRRSASLEGGDLAYQEYLMLTGRLAPVYAVGAAVGTKLFYAALRSKVGRDLARRVFAAGEGPSEQAMDNGMFRCWLRGRAADGRRAEARLEGKGDPANRITVKCVCESALTIASGSEKLPQRGGVLTPSTEIGEALAERLRARGVTMECVVCG